MSRWCRQVYDQWPYRISDVNGLENKWQFYISFVSIKKRMIRVSFLQGQTKATSSVSILISAIRKEFLFHIFLKVKWNETFTFQGKVGLTNYENILYNKIESTWWDFTSKPDILPPPPPPHKWAMGDTDLLTSEYIYIINSTEVPVAWDGF